LIIDLAHSGHKTRQDIIKIAYEQEKGHLIAYTHGSSEDDIEEQWKDKMSERAIKKSEIEQIIRNHGIIGLGVSRPFFPNTRKLAERIYDISQVDKGIDSVAIGSDFGGIPPAFLNEIRNPDDMKKLADILSEEFNLNDKNINKILRENARDWIKQVID
jgi:microsomal dipeptidase-like Zn-dependent dipeptidase